MFISPPCYLNFHPNILFCLKSAERRKMHLHVLKNYKTEFSRILLQIFLHKCLKSHIFVGVFIYIIESFKRLLLFLYTAHLNDNLKLPTKYSHFLY